MTKRTFFATLFGFLLAPLRLLFRPRKAQFYAEFHTGSMGGRLYYVPVLRDRLVLITDPGEALTANPNLKDDIRYGDQT